MNHILYHDQTSYYVIPNQADPGETIRLKLRVQHGLRARIQLLADGTHYEMSLEKAGGEFDYYETQVVLGEEVFAYSFLLTMENGEHLTLGEACPFRICPGFHVPAWAEGAVMYQIFTDRFCNGNPANDVQEGEYLYLDRPVRHASDWNALPDPGGDVDRFFGGDLQGVMHKLDYLEKLGVQVLYFNPLFLSPSNHKYDCMDYDVIDPHFGVIEKTGRLQERVFSEENRAATDAYFIEFVEQAHKHGMKVILDGVFNHCGSFHKWMNKEGMYPKELYLTGHDPDTPACGAFQSEQSPYAGYFAFEDQSGWPDNASYECWWDNPTLPKLNYEASEALCDEILRIAVKWISPPYNADGWRLDVAADLGHSLPFNHAFWKRFRKTVKKANPEALILAEHYGAADEWLLGDEWDTIMNYEAFMEPVTYFLTGMEKHSDGADFSRLGDAKRLVSDIGRAQQTWLGPSVLAAMNELSNHDHSRFLTRTNGKIGRALTLGSKAAEEGVDKNVFMEAVTMQMTWPGAPTVYYGDEAGVCGFTDPDSRRTYPWGHEDRMLLDFHKAAIRIHRDSPALQGGSMVILKAGQDVLAYGRFSDKEQIITVLYNGFDTPTFRIPVTAAEIGKTAVLHRLLISGGDSFSTQPAVYEVKDGILTIAMGPKSSMILKHTETD